MNAQLAVWHRRCGLLACAALFIFALSGLMHPVMSRLQPQPVNRDAPPTALPAQAQTPAAVLRQHGIERFAGLRLARAGEASAYRVELDDGSGRYFRATDGREIADGEALHAETLARHASGDQQSAVQELARITAFDQDYPAVNRYLPVWRVRFDRADGLTAYVDTRGDRLATLQDNPKRVAQALFRQLHNVATLEALPWLRLPLMLSLLAAALIATVSGVVLFLRTWRRQRQAAASRARHNAVTHPVSVGRLREQTARDAPRLARTNPLRRLSARDQHRYLAFAVAITTLGFIISGGWHLLHAAGQPPQSPAPLPQFATSELGDGLPTAAFQLVRVDGVPCYRMSHSDGRASPHHHHGSAPAAADQQLASCLHTATGRELPNAEQRLATALARHHAGAPSAPVASLRPILHFDADYGFASKRLPVWQVRFADDPRRWYVETSSGALALRADAATAREGWTFSHLHKWQFIPNRDLRDALLMLAALLQLAVAALGLRLFLQRRDRATRRQSAGGAGFTPAAPVDNRP